MTSALRMAIISFVNTAPSFQFVQQPTGLTLASGHRGLFSLAWASTDKDGNHVQKFPEGNHGSPDHQAAML